jgi:hypothetical protein
MIIKKSQVVLVTCLSVFIIGYVLGLIFKFELVANIFSAANAFAAAVSIGWVLYKKRGVTTPNSSLYIFSLVICFTWAIADSIWAVLMHQGINAEENKVLWIIYFIPSVLIPLGLLVPMFKNLSKWSGAQWVTDFSAILICCLLLIWSVFFESNIEIILSFFHNDFTSIASLIFDLITGIFVFQWILLLPHKKVPYLSFCIYPAHICIVSLILDTIIRNFTVICCK